MRTLKYILFIICISIGIIACSDDEGGIPATEITNLTFSTFQGSITLTWEYAESENTNRCVEIRYKHPVTQRDILKTVSGGVTSFTLNGTSKEDGEYIFYVQPFSTTFTPGQVHTVSGISKNETGVDSAPMILTADNVLAIADETGEYKTNSSFSMLFDGNFTSALSWGWYWSENPVYNIDIQLPKQQTHLKFGYYVPVSSTFRAPAEIKCYTKATAEGKWVELTTLNVANDSLPVKVPEDPSLKYVQFTSKEYKAPAAFNYVRFAFEKVSEQKGDVFTEEMQPRNPQISEWVMYDVFYKDE